MNFPKYRVHFNNRSDCSDESESDDSDDSDSDSSCSGVSSAPSNFCCPVKPPRSRSNSRSKCECKCFAEPTKSDTSKNICPSCRDGSKSSLRGEDFRLSKRKSGMDCHRSYAVSTSPMHANHLSSNIQRCEQCNKGCSILSALLHSFIILMLAGTTVLVFIWAFYFRKTVGFSATDAQANINYHPVMMISGFISLSGFSLLIYRLGQCCRHGYMQCIHLALHGLAVPCIVLGISAAFNYHKLVKPAEHHLITLHSWIGLITIILFAVQFTGGVLSFVLTNCCSGMAQRIREGFIPIHATLGMTTLLMAISTALTGLTQRILYVSQKDPKATAGTGYRGMEAYFQARIGEYSEAMIVNLLGGFLLILAVLMPISLRRKCPKPMMTCVNGCSAC